MDKFRGLTKEEAEAREKFLEGTSEIIHEKSIMEYKEEYDRIVEMQTRRYEPYRKLVEEKGREEAKKEVVRQLKMFIELIEKDGWPDIYDAVILPPGSKDLPNNIISMGELSVTLSYPWPG